MLLVSVVGFTQILVVILGDEFLKMFDAVSFSYMLYDIYKINYQFFWVLGIALKKII